MSGAWSRAGKVALIALAIAWALVSCRTPVAVEGDLDIEVFETPAASLTQDPSGQWYAVSTRGSSPREFLTISFEGKTHLFAAGRRGPRSAKILPLTKVDARWLEAAARGSARLKFHDEISDVVVDTALGLWSGEDSAPVRWLGESPEFPVRAVALTVDFGGLHSVSLPDYIAGTLEVDGEAVTARHRGLRDEGDAYIVIPDGPVTRSGPRAATLTEWPFERAKLAGWSWEQVTGPAVRNEPELREVAGQLSVEFLVARQGDDIRMGFVPDGGAPRRPGLERPVALAESGLVVDSEADEASRHDILGAMDDIYKDHPLSASYRLAQADGDWHVDGNPLATELRHQDLVAAAGYLQWMGAKLLEGRSGIGPELALYAARAFAYAEDWESTQAYAERAIRHFSEWSNQSGAIGTARARLLMSKAAEAQGDEEAAVDALSRAADDFLRGADPYHAALVRRRLILRHGAGDVQTAAQQLEDLGAGYEASRTLLLAVAQDLAEERFEAAQRRLDMWTDHWAGEASKRLLLFSWSLRDRLDWSGAGKVSPEELQERGRAAIQSRAWDAAVTSALTQHAWRAMYDEMDMGSLGEVLLEGALRSDSEIFSQQADSTLAIVCSDIVFSSDGNRASGSFYRQCHRRLGELRDTPEGLESIVQGGYRFVQHGELDAAQRLEQYVFDALQGRDGVKWGEVRARGYFFRAALTHEFRGEPARFEAENRDQAVVDAIQNGFEALARHIEPERAPSRLREFGSAFDERGFDRLTIALYEAARSAAQSANQNSEEFEAALAHADALYRARQWSDLARVENVESPLHAARIDLYRGHAEYVRENFGNARDFTRRGLSQAEEFGDFQRGSVYHLAGQMALERRDVERLEQVVDDLDGVIEGLPESLVDTEQRRILEARTRAQRVHLLAMKRDYQGARQEAIQAQHLADQLQPGSGAIHEVYVARARVVDSAADYGELVREFDDYNRMVPEYVPRRLQRDMVRTLVELALENGAYRQALSRMRSVIGEGLGMALNRQVHHCWIATVRFHVDHRSQAEFHHERCVDGAPQSVQAGRSQLLAAMVDAEATASYRRGVARHLRELLADDELPENARLDWLISFSEPRRDESASEYRALTDRVADSRDDDTRRGGSPELEATIDLVEYLLDTANYEQLDQLLDSDAGIFFEEDLAAEPKWVALRTRSQLRQLRPFAAMESVTRLMDHASVTRVERARALYHRAIAHFQLGHFFAALRDIEAARDQEAGESELAADLDALESAVRTSRFGP